ncbi:DUF567-domain-containing protein [Meredithblackwellia eburnea MCA 4105]
MGLFSDSTPAPLQPFNPPVGVHPHYCVQPPTTLVLKESGFFSGDDFSIKDSNGVDVVVCKGRAFTIGDRKEFHDSTGRPLFSLRNKTFSMHHTMIGEDATGKEIFTTKKHFGVGTKMTLTFNNTAHDGQPMELELRGDFWGGSADIAINGRPAAQISRDLMNMREIFRDKQTYFVTVAPGVDLALIAAFCVCFDEVKNEKK